MAEVKNLISLVLEEQHDNPELNNQMSTKEIYYSICRKYPTSGIMLTDVEKALDEMDNVGCDKTYFYRPLNLAEVDYKAPFCQCSPTCISEKQTQEWHEFEVCTNCNRPIEGTKTPIGDE